MHYQEETEPAGKQDWLEIDPSPVPGGRAKGRPVWLCCLAESSIEAWGSMGKFVFLDLIGWGGGGMQRLGRYTLACGPKAGFFELPRHWDSGSSYTCLSEVQATYCTLLGVSTGA